MNVTVPVGVPAAGAAAFTVAVNVTDCPYTDGLLLDVTVVAVLPFCTIRTELPVLPVCTESAG
jgi:hypothetical protein